MQETDTWGSAVDLSVCEYGRDAKFISINPTERSLPIDAFFGFDLNPGTTMEQAKALMVMMESLVAEFTVTGTPPPYSGKVEPETETYHAEFGYKGGSFGPGRRKYISFWPCDELFPMPPGGVGTGSYSLLLDPNMEKHEVRELLQMVANSVTHLQYTGPIPKPVPMGRGQVARNASDHLDKLVASRKSG